MTCLYSPLRGLLTHLATRWRDRHGCRHVRSGSGCDCGRW